MLTCASSVIIDDLERRVARQQESRVLYFYFDYRRQTEQTPFRVLLTLLRQLLSTHSTVPSPALELVERLETHHDLPGWHDITKIFLNLCSSNPGKLFIVFDALDEC